MQWRWVWAAGMVGMFATSPEYNALDICLKSFSPSMCLGNPFHLSHLKPTDTTVYGCWALLMAFGLACGLFKHIWRGWDKAAAKAKDDMAVARGVSFKRAFPAVSQPVPLTRDKKQAAAAKGPKDRPRIEPTF